MWPKVVSFFTKLWELLKKTPGWILLILLGLVAIVWWLMNRQLLLKKKLEIQKNIAEIEKEAASTRATANATHSAEMDAAQETYDKTIQKLKKKEKIIDEAAKKGPVAIAEEWKSFLSGGK